MIAVPTLPVHGRDRYPRATWISAAALFEAIDGREFVEPIWTPDPRFIAHESSGPVPR